VSGSGDGGWVESGYARNGPDEDRAESNADRAIAKTDADAGGGGGDDIEEVGNVNEVENDDVDEVEDDDVDG
jgi:hypothetical protein